MPDWATVEMQRRDMALDMLDMLIDWITHSSDALARAQNAIDYEHPTPEAEIVAALEFAAQILDEWPAP